MDFNQAISKMVKDVRFLFVKFYQNCSVLFIDVLIANNIYVFKVLSN